ncbi:MAG: Gfo/Idh/MocA family protein [Ardenticatenaceae bacterium]
MSKAITAVMMGAGLRGTHAYGPYALQHPDELNFVAVAEPNEVRRRQFAELHNIPVARQFRTWEELIAKGQLADVAFNMTQDQMHYRSTLATLEAGYDMLLEKPMTTRLAQTVHLVQTAEKHGRLLQVCHVLRYTSFFSTLHDILASGRLGEIMTVEHRENVVYWHMAHSFVRGNWRNEGLSSPMILAKCSHDLDLLYWNLGQPVEKLQSFGSLLHYRPENAPQGATERCTDGCPAAEGCPFDARKIYLEPNEQKWPATAISDDQSLPARRRALETGPYGRCVYKCDNDVVDHQTLSMQFPNGASVVLFMHGHSHEESRTMRYDGTRATLRGKFDYHNGWIEIHDHVSNECEQIHIPAGASGHGGGDAGVVSSFVRAIRREAEALTTARESLESHLMAFAAEESRLNGTVVDMNEFRQRAEESTKRDTPHPPA